MIKPAGATLGPRVAAPYQLPAHLGLVPHRRVTCQEVHPSGLEPSSTASGDIWPLRMKVSAAVSVVLRNRVALAQLACLKRLLIGAQTSQVTITPGFSAPAGHLGHMPSLQEASR